MRNLLNILYTASKYEKRHKGCLFSHLIFLKFSPVSESQ